MMTLFFSDHSGTHPEKSKESSSCDEVSAFQGNLLDTPHHEEPSSSWGVFVLNLPHSAKRWQHIFSLVKSLGRPVYRVQGLDGRTLSQEDMDTFHQDRWHKAFFGKTMGKGTLACALGHRFLWKAFLKTPFPFGLMCEDDISFNPEHITLFVNHLINHLSGKDKSQVWDIVSFQLNHWGLPIPVAALPLKHRLCAYGLPVTGAGCYLLTRHAAQVLLREAPRENDLAKIILNKKVPKDCPLKKDGLTKNAFKSHSLEKNQNLLTQETSLLPVLKERDSTSHLSFFAECAFVPQTDKNSQDPNHPLALPLTLKEDFICSPILWPVDHDFTRYWKYGLRFMGVEPRLVTPALHFESDIEKARRQKRNEKKIFSLLVRASTILIHGMAWILSYTWVALKSRYFK